MDINTKENYFSVAVYLLGDELSPSEVTRILGIEPSDASVTGEKRKSSSGAIATTRIGRWVFRSPHKMEVDSDDLADHIRYIAKMFKNKGDDIKKLKGVDQAFIDIYSCSEMNDNPTFSYTFSVEEMQFFSSLSLPLEITVEFAER